VARGILILKMQEYNHRRAAVGMRRALDRPVLIRVGA
jgi:hypothetical protein